MKILLINSYHYRKGGADGVYFNTGDLLTEAGHEVFYFSTINENNVPAKSDHFFAKGQDYRKLGFTQKLAATPSFFYNAGAYKSLSRLIDEVKPDIAHIHLFLGTLSSSILKALSKRGIPIVHSVHDYRILCPAYLFIDGNNEICEKCKDGFYIRCALKRCSENSFTQSLVLSADAYVRKRFIRPVEFIDRFIFVSNFIKEKHVEFDSRYESKSEVLHNFRPDLKSIEASSSQGQYFLYFGRLSREKGIFTLVEAASQAGIRLKIVGTGPLYEELRSKNMRHVEIVGFKQGDELWSLVKDASFVVVPSEWYENNPLTIIEAYACGKPVIASSIGGIPEIVEDNVTGYLFPAGDKIALEKLLRKASNLSDADYKKMSNEARSFADRNFNPEIHYTKLMDIYKDVIKKNKKTL